MARFQVITSDGESVSAVSAPNFPGFFTMFAYDIDKDVTAEVMLFVADLHEIRNGIDSLLATEQ